MLAFPDAAGAYLDPGTGSVLVQLLLGGVAGFVVLLKLYWSRVRTWLPGAKRDAATRGGRGPGG